MAEAPTQLLSLKVMRVSRPALSTAWEPFYSSSSSFSAHSTASLMSLQGKDPLPGHPKTLRDLTHISEVLTLPSAFGAIQLGETFSSCLSVNNEAPQVIEGVTLRVEMQTATTKTTLAEHVDCQLAAGDTLEQVVHHEIKELGQHVLACTVSYRLPSGHRQSHSSSDAQDPSVQSFRKFYKFAVTNPLSVKTKVHAPRSPTALLSPQQREKVFLEVHIQNLTPDALWLQRMRFECSEGWDAQDVNQMLTSEPTEETTVFSGSMALLQPQDTRQYLYVLAPKTIAPFSVVHAPGSIIPLGRLDISWRSSFGEPGRLLTSMLSRRIPLIQAPQGSSQPPALPPKQPVSALPLHLQRSNTVGGTATPPRVGSPQLVQRPMSPPVTGPVPYRPGSPFRVRQTTSISAPPHSPNVPALPSTAVRRSDEMIHADLIVRHIPRGELTAERPFKMDCTITLSAPIPPSTAGQGRRERLISLAVQHVLPPRFIPKAAAPVPTAAGRTESWSPKLPSSGFSTPSPYGTPFRGDFPDTLAQRLLVASPRQAQADLESDAGTDADGHDTGQVTPAPPGQRDEPTTIILPPPFAAVEPGTAPRTKPVDVAFLGPSTTILPQIRVPVPTHDYIPSREFGHDRTLSDSTTDSETDDDELSETIGKHVPRMLMSQEFQLEFLPLRAGFVTVGGLRVLLVEDRLVDVDGDEVRSRRPADARTLREWDVIAELWVKGAADKTS